MPEISRFYARYGENKAVIEISSLRVLEEKLPPRVLELIAAWASQHQSELMDNWNATISDMPTRKIPPL